MLLQMARLWSFIWLSNIPLYLYPPHLYSKKSKVSPWFSIFLPSLHSLQQVHLTPPPKHDPKSPFLFLSPETIWAQATDISCLDSSSGSSLALQWHSSLSFSTLGKAAQTVSEKQMSVMPFLWFKASSNFPSQNKISDRTARPAFFLLLVSCTHTHQTACVHLLSEQDTLPSTGLVKKLFIWVFP